MFIITLISCNENNKQNLELEILNNKVETYKDQDSTYCNVLTYRLKNNTGKTYCILPNEESSLTYKLNCLNIENLGCVFISKDDTLKINRKFVNFSDTNFQNDLFKLFDEKSKKLGYKINGYSKDYIDKNRFFIHPNEIIYFEKLICLPLPDKFSSRLDFDNNKKYSLRIFIHSDSTNYKNILSRTDIRTVEDNSYEVYHGIIESVNTVPVKVLD